MRFNRVVSEELLDALSTDGPLSGLVARRAQHPEVCDVQLRHEQRGTRSWASLYVGLTSVLDVDERAGRFRLRAHSTHRQAGGFDPGWAEWQDVAQLATAWPQVGDYLDRLLAEEGVARALWRREGVVHAALCSDQSPAYGAIQREAGVSFRSTPEREEIVAPMRDRIWEAVEARGRQDPWWPGVRDRGVRPRLGLEADLLATDTLGRLLVIEAKPSDETKGIAWGPAQVRLYAEVFAELLRRNPETVGVISSCAQQRHRLGLLGEPWQLDASTELRVAPVLAIGAGTRSPVVLDRLAAVASAIDDRPPVNPLIDPLEVWLLDEHGHPTTIWLPGAEPTPVDQRPQSTGWASPSTFTAEARQAATAWKHRTHVLSDDAREAGRYGTGPPLPFCLPAASRDLNLLSEAREIALSRFESAGISWHGDAGGPSNHLLSSQVQCLNALAPFAVEPSGLQALLGGVLPIQEVLPFGAMTTSPYDATDHVVFEWQGLVDHLGEWREEPPIRGAHATSADAAVRYRTRDGTVELALIEWKYTERYPDGSLSGGSRSRAFRHARYREAFDDPAASVRHDVVPYEAFFAEPVYQLFRLQLLAWRMEAAGELGADRVRVLYVAPGRNAELWASVPPAFAAGTGQTSLLPAWRDVLRQPDRFAFLDSAELVASSSPTSAEFKDRYQHLAPTVGMPDPETVVSTTDLAAELTQLIATLERVGGDGSVLDQVQRFGPAALDQLPHPVRSELAARSRELTSLARQLRAGPLAQAQEMLGAPQDER